MSIKESKIKILIRGFLSEESLLRKDLIDPRIEFGFQFVFPPGQESHIMATYKPKNKDLLIVSIGTQIADPHVEALNSLENEKRNQFFMDLRKFFLSRDVFYRINVQKYRYEISDQIFIESNESVSKNLFFKSVQKIFNSAVYSNIILGEYCLGKITAEDFTKIKEFSSGPNFSLYS